ncbi:MAG TPA: hypothetical protein VJK02_15060 [Anaerolineales bacterium]|nr:hypothetical protein [Anaerolineales bacterium]
MDLGQRIAIYLGVFLLIWFAVAAAYNRRRGVRVYRWLQPGLKGLGTITEAKWIGSSGSGARLAIGKPERPFRRIEAAFLLETRELLPLWILNRLRGRRDMLIIRADLRSAPHGELEIVPPGDRRLGGLQQDKRGVWTMLTGLPAGFQGATRGREVDRFTRSANVLLDRQSQAIRHLSIGQKSPHLIIEADLTVLMEAQAEDFFVWLKEAFGADAPVAE